MQVAVWGARLASLTPRRSSADCGTVLLEAAAFNLAVALFDTATDEMPARLPGLAEALRPDLLERCLEEPEGGGLDPAAVEDGLSVVVRLFVYVLTSAGQRFRCDAPARADLAHLLRLMYESELGVGGQPGLAKTLPVVWIGRLAGAGRGSAAAEMFERLAQFIAHWDDAQDLTDDWLRGRYNAYLAFSRGGWSPLGGALIGTSRLLLGRRSARGLGLDLHTLLREALDAADRCGRGEAVACFLADLIGGAA